MQAYIDDFNLITVQSNVKLNGSFEIDNDGIFKLELIKQFKRENNYYYRLKMSHPIHLSQTDHILYDGQEIPLFIGDITRTSNFESVFSALDETLGATIEDNKTTFSVWSPVAQSINVVTDERTYEMTRKDNGTYTVVVDNNLHGISYQYEVMINNKRIRVNDPYAKGLTVNSTKSVVIDMNQVQDFPSQFPEIERNDVIIYEVHTRDFSMHPNSGIQHKGKLLGLIEEGTSTHTGHTTGFDYIKSLGISHIELLPVNDFARVDDIDFMSNYNWGYDPEFYQTIDGSYSTDAMHPVRRIEELKMVVQKYHEAGMGVILDVVFNHVYKMETSPFEQLVPGYYFRYHKDRTLSNGTGVGNDIKTERVMMRKYILDTLEFYIDTFKIDGFRFDLMGVIDIETMQHIERLIQSKNKYGFILGEGWNLYSAMPDAMKTIHENIDQVPDVHFFNDFFRDTLKGNNFDLKDRGYFNGKGRYYERMFTLFTGQTGIPAKQSINYAEVHDNHTLFDRINYTTQTDMQLQHKIHQMITIFTILSLGTPFIHAGQEFFRTKYGHGNTYNLSDFINRIDWNRRIKYDKELDVIKQALKIKRTYEIFKVQTLENKSKRIIQLNIDQPLFGVLLFDRRYEFILLFNPTAINYDVSLPRMGQYEVVLTNESTQQKFVQSQVTLNPYQCLLMKKEF
ncbi:type I pullulanase [Macrococcoides caseolyticum]|uniref:type I pullulanase n=1 Tax=Macrococcoides caseolyticum TaxID=69966 RepID=UPI000C32ADC7|nr:type I pullulanase [Macrococcus caseolyticus]PKF46333.1 type I pullulanase [Macrococcus caseolyticus]